MYIIRSYTSLYDKVVYDRIICILYYILAYIQHNRNASLENVRLLLCSISVHKRHSSCIGRSDIL